MYIFTLICQSFFASILSFRVYDDSCHCLAFCKERPITALAYLFEIKPIVVFLFQSLQFHYRLGCVLCILPLSFRISLLVYVRFNALWTDSFMPSGSKDTFADDNKVPPLLNMLA